MSALPPREAELVLGRRGVVVLGVTCENEEYIGVPVGDTRLKQGESVLVYGLGKDINKSHHTMHLEDLPLIEGRSNVVHADGDAAEEARENSVR